MLTIVIVSLMIPIPAPQPTLKPPTCTKTIDESIQNVCESLWRKAGRISLAVYTWEKENGGESARALRDSDHGGVLALVHGLVFLRVSVLTFGRQLLLVHGVHSKQQGSFMHSKAISHCKEIEQVAPLSVLYITLIGVF